MSEPSPRKFLCVVDDTPECQVAVRYAARRAEHTLGHVALVNVIEPVDRQQWMAVEARMREEAYSEAERALYQAAALVNQASGGRPELIIREGQPLPEVTMLLKQDPSISILVLGAGTSKAGPGPLVSALIGTEMTKSFPIPVTIVPGNLSDEDLDALA
jgi:nucleotide-binding universal stress UspA family protein